MLPAGPTLVGGRSWRGRPVRWPELEKDNPQEPRPGGRRANPPAPGRLGPWGSSAPRGTPVAFPSLARESLVLRPEGRLNLTAATAGCATHRPAVRRPDPSALLAGTPTRISRSNRVGPSGQLFIIGAQEVAVKATFPLARRVCPAHEGWNYLHGISGDEPSLGPSAPGCPPVPWHRHRRPWRAGSRPGPGCAVLCSPRARAASLDLARSLARWLARRRPPASARAEVTTRRATVVKDADTSVLVHRVETALVVLTPEMARAWPADDQQRAGSKGQQR
jgi:hypothetical protein